MIMKDEEIKGRIAEKEDGGIIYDAEIVGETEDKPSGGKTVYLPPQRPLWMDLLIIVGVYIGSTIIFGLFAGLFAGLTKGDALLATVVAQVMVYLVTIPVSVWLLRKRGMKKPILSFSLRKANPLMILWGFLLIFIMGVVIEPLINLFPDSYMNDVNDIVLNGGGLGMLMVVIMAPLFEEMLFRGIIQGGASHEYGPVKAILVSSAIFGLIHLVPQQVINAFLCGLILGYIYYRTGSLIPVIAIHLLNNAFAYIATRMSPENANETMRQLINNDTWYWILYAVCAVIFVLAMFKLWQQLNKADEKAKLEAK